MKNYQNLDNLIQGIKVVLLENRCSFNDEEKVLLQNCLTFLEETKEKNKTLSLEDIAEIAIVLLKLFTDVKDIF